MTAARCGTNDSRSDSHSARTVSLVARASSMARNRCWCFSQVANRSRIVASMFSRGEASSRRFAAAASDSAYISSIRAATAAALLSK